MAFAEGSQDGTLNGTNAVTVVSSPGASTRRIVKLINIHNVDTVSQTISVFYVHGASSRKLRSVTLGSVKPWSSAIRSSSTTRTKA